jgi:hypothetical protein
MADPVFVQERQPALAMPGVGADNPFVHLILPADPLAAKPLNQVKAPQDAAFNRSSWYPEVALLVFQILAADCAQPEPSGLTRPRLIF